MNTVEENETVFALQKSYKVAELTLQFFRDMMNDPTRNPVRDFPQFCEDEAREKERQERLHEAIDQAEAMALAYLARQPLAVHRWVVESGSPISFMGFQSEQFILPGERRRVEGRPQVHLIPVEVCIPADIAPHFSIESIRMGYREVFVSNDPVPAEAMADKRMACRVLFPACLVGMICAWTVVNRGRKPLQFRASFKGPCSE